MNDCATKLKMDSWDRAIEWVLTILLVIGPLLLGVISETGELAVLILAGVLLALLGLKHATNPNAEWVWHGTYPVIALIVLLVAIQAIPLPLKLVRMISPETVALKLRLLGDLGEGIAWLKLSFNPVETVRGLRLVFGLALVFLVVTQVYSDWFRIRRLLLRITLVGGVVALLALAQDWGGNGRIFWLFETHDGARSGPFVNHSHFGQYMNLSIGSALGLLGVLLREPREVDGLVGPTGVARRLLRSGTAEVWMCIGMVVLGTVAVFLALTRGGMVALLLAGGFTSVLVAVQRGLQSRNWAIILVIILAFLGILYVGFDAVYARLSTLGDIEQAGHSRWLMVQTLVRSWSRFQLLGSGLNSHEVIYPIFDDSTRAILRGHADVEYGQLAEETGSVGLGLILLLVGMVWVSYRRAVVQAGRFPTGLAAFGLGFGLLAAMIQSVSDYGQRLWAIGMLTVVCGGLLVNLGRVARHGPVEFCRPGKSHSRAPALGVLVSLLVIWVGMLPSAVAASRGQRCWDETLVLEKRMAAANWLGDNEAYAALIASAQRAVDHQPDQVHYRYWLNAYRWRAISRVADPETGLVIMTGETLDYTRRIVAELLAARVLCPTFGALYSLAGQLQFYILNESAGAVAIRQGYELAPCDPACCLAAGRLDGVEGKIELSIVKLRHTLALDGGMIDEVLAVLIDDLARPDLALGLAGGQAGWLVRLADMLEERPGRQALASEARILLLALLEEQAAEPGVEAGTLAALGRLYRRQGKNLEAVSCYRRALALDYSQVEWRLALAHTLAQAGRTDEAVREARICLRLRPELNGAQRLVMALAGGGRGVQP